MIVVCAADGLGHDRVDDSKLQQVGRGNLQRRCRLDLAFGVTPENRSASLGRNHAVDRELLHQDPVAYRDSQRAAASALPTHHDDDGDLEDAHFPEIDGDGLSDAALLGFDARVRRRSVDEHDDRPPELLGELHHTKRLAVALRARVAEVPEDLLFGVPPLLMPDNGDVASSIVAEAADDGVIVGEPAIAVQFVEAGEQPLHIVERVGAVGMPGDENALPGREVGVDLDSNLVGAFLKGFDGPLALGRARQHAQRLDFLQQDADRFLEFQQVSGHVGILRVSGSGIRGRQISSGSGIRGRASMFSSTRPLCAFLIAIRPFQPRTAVLLR